jgi:protein-disulfide isomerase
VEYTDYQCPFCKRFFEATFGQLKKEYIDTGKIRFVVRDFPLVSIHPNAQKSAEAAQCAGEQKKYYEFHDKLYSTQDTWSQDTSDVAVATFKQFASALGLNINQFNSCLDSGKMAEKITKSTNEAAGYGVQGTPAFFINGNLLSGAQPFTAFQTAIDAALK